MKRHETASLAFQSTFSGLYVLTNLLSNVTLGFPSAQDRKTHHESQLQFKFIHFGFCHTLQVGLQVFQVLECAAASLDKIPVKESSVLTACLHVLRILIFELL